MILLSCNESVTVREDLDDKIIDSFGEYTLKGKDLQLIVLEKDELLDYKLVIAGDTVITSYENASIYQRWGIYLDDKLNLWVHSSDIGMWVWCNMDGFYTRFRINERPLSCQSVPKQFLDHLSTVHRSIIK